MSNTFPPSRFFWIDLEMTGLDPRSDRILEAAVIVTDNRFHPLHSFQTALFQTPETLVTMNAWCQKHHRDSGLLERIPEGVSEQTLEQHLLQIAEQWFPAENIILCGNSVAQDRRFIESWLPAFAQKLHYRLLDVTAFKVVFSSIYQLKFEKKQSHRALDDIRESIAELQFYLSFIQPNRNQEVQPPA